MHERALKRKNGFVTEYSFKNEGKLTISMESITVECTYTLNGERISVFVSMPDGTEAMYENAIWNIENDVLTIDDGKEAVSFTRKQ